MKKLVIKPYRQRVGMDAALAQDTWEFLRAAMREIFSHNASQLSFEELFRSSYYLVLQKHGDLLYNGVVQVITEQCEGSADEIASTPNENLLAFFNQKWNDYQVIITMIRDVLMYMEHNYVPQKRKTPIHQRSLLIFLAIVVRNERIQSRLRSLLLQNIARERHGELIDRVSMNNTLCMLVILGIHSNCVYEEEFEKYFLVETLDFYRQEAQKYLDDTTCGEYLIKAEQRLQEEALRVSYYLNSSTDHKLRRIVETELIEKQAKILVEQANSGCWVMFRDGNTDSLRKMYQLFRRIPKTLEIMSESVFGYIKHTGEQLVQAQLKPETAVDAKQFVDQLMNLRKPFVDFWQQCFQEDPEFQKSIKRGFEAFLNINTICSGYLAHYLDEILRSKARYEEELETLVSQVIALFRYLQDKDVFEEFYKNLLARRLLRDRGASDEAERMVIAKLREECGYQFTSKLEGMFKDINVSKDIMGMFRKAQPQHQMEDGTTIAQLSVHVLTSGFWPLSTPSMSNIPPELKQLIDSFEFFYLARHNGRKLTWATQLGSVDIRARFRGQNGARIHELNVSTYQAYILMLFNLDTCWSFKKILERTQIQEHELKRHLISLCTPKFRILLKSSKGKRIDTDDVFTLNDAYQSKLHRVRIPLISQKETSLILNTAYGGDGKGIDQIQVPPTVAEDRKHLYPFSEPISSANPRNVIVFLTADCFFCTVEAVIVRVMKARRQMEHSHLIAEVVRQMAGRFTPSPQLIKMRIESLIERDYLQRSVNDRRLYHYLA
uniref:Cullin family protein putative n=1 Tax=Albugo laibachii Nc14 TaxID=890382 RepID=F0WC08_9STRA|nr:Cullin family protein putative [Albugo laibachii Nc14]|eukprot:CCA18689.1 Cullin family protein putative [Albugo laibachii Nc14]